MQEPIEIQNVFDLVSRREGGMNFDAGPGFGDDNPFLTLSMDPAGCRPLLESGTRLGRFHIKKHLGRGSLGDVYLAHDEVSGEAVAIKIVVKTTGEEEGAPARLRGERTAYTRIQDHHHILKVHDLHSIPKGGAELLVLSMEYADGGTFRDWLRVHRDAPEVRRTQGMDHFKALCRGVAAGHEVGVAHLDVKPENFLQVNGVWKVSDFGVSTCTNRTENNGSASRKSGSSGCISGTPVYMSPEHFITPYPDDLDGRSDIYSLGIILFELLHPQGRQPFVGDFEQLMMRHSQSPPPPLPGAGPGESRVIKRCLEKDPTMRYPTIQALLDDLEGRGESSEVDNEHEEEIETAWQEACQCIEENRFNDSKRLCSHVLELCPEHTEARRLLETLQERYEQAGRLYTAIEQGLDLRNLDELGSLLIEAVHLYPNHSQGHVVQKRLEIKARQYREAMEEGSRCVHMGDFEGALTWFERARQLSPGTTTAEYPVRFTTRVLQKIRETRQRIDAAAAAGNRNRAMALARKLDEYKAWVRKSTIRQGEGP